MKRAYKYRIYPTEEQKKYFNTSFAANRWFYNYALEKINKTYEETKEHLSAQYQVARELPALKKEENTKWINQVDAMSFIYTAQALDAAFKKFFKEKTGFPKFKSNKYDNSYTIQVKNGREVVDFKRNLIKIGKVGVVKAKVHRKFQGQAKAITVSKKSYDYYEASILVDDNFNKLQLKEHTEQGTIGIDLGVKTDSNAILSDGTMFPTIKANKELKKIKRLQKKLSKKQWIETGEMKFSKKYNKDVKVKKPSNNYIKLKNKIAKLQDKIARKRQYNTHQITSYVTNPKNNVDTIAIENLNVKGMLKNHHIANAVSNSNMGEVKRQLEYKCDWYGKHLVEVDRFFPSSQICNVCGYQNKNTKNLSLRQWICPQCGTHHNRDVNAAINIKNEGHRILTTTEGKQ